MAQEAKHNIDDYFRDRLYNYNPPAPEDMWLKINEETKKRKKLALWVTLGSVAASITIIISLSIGYYFGSISTRKQLSIHNNLRKENTNTVSKSYNSGSYKEKEVKSSLSNEIKKSSSTNIYQEKQEKSNAVTSNNQIASKSKKEENVPYYIKEKTGSLQEMKLASITKLPERKSSRLLTSKEVYAYYFKNNDEPDLMAEQPKNRRNSWELGGIVAPLYTKWNVQDNSLYTSEYVNSVETGVLAYSGGINVRLSSSRWKFETGINYSWSNQNLADVANNLMITKVNSNSNYRVDDNDPIKINDEPKNYANKDIIPSSNLVNNTGNVYILQSKKEPNTTYLITNNSKSYEQGYYSNSNINNTREISRFMHQSNKYITIPFLAHYKIIDKKADVFLSGGLSTNILVKAKRDLEVENKTYSLDTLITNKRFNYSGVLGVNIELPIVEKLSIKMEPCINYNINSIEKNNSAHVYPYSLGIFSGIFYKF